MGSGQKKSSAKAQSPAVANLVNQINGGSSASNDAPRPVRNLSRAISGKEESKPMAGKSLTATPAASRRARANSNYRKVSTLLGQ